MGLKPSHNKKVNSEYGNGEKEETENRKMSAGEDLHSDSILKLSSSC